jgi:fibronectin-binding autotransporter adhesin
MKPKNQASRSFLSLIFAGTAAALLASHTTTAETITWNAAGATTTSWAFGPNWIGGNAPVAGDDVFVTADGAIDPTNNSGYAGIAINSLTLTGGQTLTLSSALQVGAGGVWNTMTVNSLNLKAVDLTVDQTWGGTRTTFIQGPITGSKMTFDGSGIRFDVNSPNWAGGVDIRTSVNMGSGNFDPGPITPYGTGTITLINQRFDGSTASAPVLRLAAKATNDSVANANTIANAVTLSDPSTSNFTITQSNDAIAGNGHYYILSGDITGAVNSARTLSFTNTHGAPTTTPATIILTGNNTYTARTIIGANTTLQLGNNLSLQNSVLTTSSGSVIIDPAVTAPVLGGLSGSVSLNAFITEGYGGVTSLTLNTAAGTAVTYSGSIDDGASALNLIKTGPGTQTLSGSNSYTGTTTVSGGVLSAASYTSLPGYDSPAKVIFNGGTLAVRANGADWTMEDVDTLLANATKTSGALGIDTSGGAIIQSDSFNTTSLGVLGLAKIGSNALTLDQANSHSGGTSFAGTLVVGASGALGSGSLVSTASSTLVFDTPASATFSNPMTLIGAENNSINNLSETSTITLNGGMQASAGFFTFVGTGVNNAGFVLGGTNTFPLSRLVAKDTSLTIASGTVLSFSNFPRISLGDSGGSAAAVYLLDGADLDVKVIDSNNTNIAGPMTFTVGMKTAGTATISGTATANVAVDLHVRNTGGTNNTWNFEAVSGATANFTGAIVNTGTNAQSPVTKTGLGTVVLSGTNTYTGTTTVSQGTLGFAGGSQASPITVESGAALQFAVGSPTTSSSSVTLDPGAVIKISGTPVSPNDYILLTAANGITGTPVLDGQVNGYILVLESGNTVLKLQSTGEGSNFSTWASAFTSPPLSNTAATADPDNDGLTNAMEYALGLDPRFSSPSPGVMSNGGKTITFTKGAEAKANGDVTYQIETSATLGVAPTPWAVNVADVTQTADTISITFPNGPVKNFARLKVTLAP